jgi:hypothetical protein
VKERIILNKPINNNNLFACRVQQLVANYIHICIETDSGIQKVYMRHVYTDRKKTAYIVIDYEILNYHMCNQPLYGHYISASVM